MRMSVILFKKQGPERKDNYLTGKAEITVHAQCHFCIRHSIFHTNILALKVHFSNIRHVSIVVTADWYESTLFHYP